MIPHADQKNEKKSWLSEDTRQFENNLSDEALARMANRLRLDVIFSIYLAGDGHPGPSMSIAEIIAHLYFRTLRIDPKNPDWPQRDRLILSKGHACPILYAALARRGYFPVEQLAGLRSFYSHLQGHPDMLKTPGVDMTSGSLGNGIALAAGMAIAGRLLDYDSRYYVITGDGELSEGAIWEGVSIAAHHKLDRLIVFVDANHMQSGGPVERVSGLYPLAPKFSAFGWQVIEIDGHDMSAIGQAIEMAHNEKEQPTAILCHTVKGKGIPYMEGDNSWHKRVPTASEVEEAIRALGSDCL